MDKENEFEESGVYFFAIRSARNKIGKSIHTCASHNADVEPEVVITNLRAEIKLLERNFFGEFRRK